MAGGSDDGWFSFFHDGALSLDGGSLNHSESQSSTTTSIESRLSMRSNDGGGRNHSDSDSSSVESSREDGDILPEDLTGDEVMMIGLATIGIKQSRIQRAALETNQERFKAYYGSSPNVCAAIWRDIRKDEINKNGDDETLQVKHFLVALHHLKRYPTELEREALFGVSCKTGREWCWKYIEKVQALKVKKIRWPTGGDNVDDDIWIISVDGIHCWIQEPKHPEWSQDKSYFSHKYRKAGLDYELGISLSSSRLVWMNGPYKAGENDKSIFSNHGLKAKLLESGKKAIGDRGYNGHPNEASFPNAHDSKHVKKFKSRALMRHESFNGLLKTFGILSSRFRHSIERFKNSFEAVCVICQYQIEIDTPLFPILIRNLVLEDAVHDDADNHDDDDDDDDDDDTINDVATLMEQFFPI